MALYGEKVTLGTNEAFVTQLVAETKNMRLTSSVRWLKTMNAGTKNIFICY